MAHPKRYVQTEPQNVTLLGKRVFTDVIKIRILRGEHLGLGWGLNAVSDEGFGKRQKRRRHRDTEDAVAEVEPCVYKPGAPEDGQKLGETGADSPSYPRKEPALWTPWSQTSGP